MSGTKMNIQYKNVITQNPEQRDGAYTFTAGNFKIPFTTLGTSNYRPLVDAYDSSGDRIFPKLISLEADGINMNAVVGGTAYYNAKVIS